MSVGQIDVAIYFQRRMRFHHQLIPKKKCWICHTRLRQCEQRSQNKRKPFLYSGSYLNEGMRIDCDRTLFISSACNKLRRAWAGYLKRNIPGRIPASPINPVSGAKLKLPLQWWVTNEIREKCASAAGGWAAYSHSAGVMRNALSDLKLILSSAVAVVLRSGPYFA